MSLSNSSQMAFGSSSRQVHRLAEGCGSQRDADAAQYRLNHTSAWSMLALSVCTIVRTRTRHKNLSPAESSFQALIRVCCCRRIPSSWSR